MDFDEFYERFELYDKKIKEFRTIIREEHLKYNNLVAKMNELYKYLKQIAPIFYKENEYVDYSEFYRTLIQEVKYIESLIPKNYFIIESEPNFVFQNHEPKKPLNNPIEILDWLVYIMAIA